MFTCLHLGLSVKLNFKKKMEEFRYIYYILLAE